MNTPDPLGDLLQPRSLPDSGAVGELQERFTQLQTLFVIALAAIVIMSLFICAFIGKQWRMVRAQVEEQRPSVQKMRADYFKTSYPLMQSFTARLQTFATTNRDFQPVLERYRGPLGEFFTSTTPANTPGK
jgi:hypothetical protein